MFTYKLLFFVLLIIGSALQSMDYAPVTNQSLLSGHLYTKQESEYTESEKNGFFLQNETNFVIEPYIGTGKNVFALVESETIIEKLSESIVPNAFGFIPWNADQKTKFMLTALILHIHKPEICSHLKDDPMEHFTQGSNIIWPNLQNSLGVKITKSGKQGVWNSCNIVLPLNVLATYHLSKNFTLDDSSIIMVPKDQADLINKDQ